MLINESRWRAGIIGDWSKPLIKAETKWRYKLYKQWLQFLDEGLGDGFDVVADGFSDYYDSDYDDDDDSSGNKAKSKVEAYDKWMTNRVENTDGWTDVKVEQRQSMREFRDASLRRRLQQDKDDDDDDVDFDVASSSRRRYINDENEYFDSEKYLQNEKINSRRQWEDGQWFDDSTTEKEGQGNNGVRIQQNRSREGNKIIQTDDDYQDAWQRSAKRAPVIKDNIENTP